MFLDEPTVGLDAIARRRILQYLKERARTGLSIVFTTHILHEADVLCDRIAVLHLGRLIALDTAEALKVKHGGAREVSVTFTAALPSVLREELAQALAAQAALVLEIEGSPNAATRLVFRAKNAEELLPWFSHWAQEHGLGLGRLSIEEATLEGAFLGMVGLADQDESTGVVSTERGAEALPPGRTEGLT